MGKKSRKAKKRQLSALPDDARTILVCYLTIRPPQPDYPLALVIGFDAHSGEAVVARVSATDAARMDGEIARGEAVVLDGVLPPDILMVEPPGSPLLAAFEPPPHWRRPS